MPPKRKVWNIVINLIDIQSSENNYAHTSSVVWIFYIYVYIYIYGLIYVKYDIFFH